MNRKFKKALKKAYDIPRPIHKEEFLDNLKKRYPKAKKCRYNFFYSKNTIRLLSAVLTVLFVIGVHNIYNNISYLEPIPIINSIKFDSDESSMFSQNKNHPSTTTAISKNNTYNDIPTSTHTEFSETILDSHENKHIVPANTNKITNTKPKVTALLSNQENKITKTTVALKPNNTGSATQINTQPSAPSASHTAMTTKLGNSSSDKPNEDVNNVVTTSPGEQGSDNHKPTILTTTYLGFQGEANVTTVSSTTIQTEPTTIPIENETESENSINKTHPDIYFNREKILYND